MTAGLLVKGKMKMAVMPAVTSFLLYYNAMDRGTDCSVVSTV